MRRLSMVGTFAVRSLVVMAVFAVMLGLLVSARIERLYLDGFTRSAKAVAAAGLDHEIRRSGVLAGQSTDGERASLRTSLANEMRGAGISSVKIWDAEGRLVFASDSGADDLGNSLIDDPEVARALGGQTISLVDREDELTDLPRDMKPSVEVYLPMVDGVTGEIVGVLEIYQSYGPVASAMRGTIMLMWGVVLVGTALAYAVQVGFVRGMERRLVDTEEQVGSVNERLEHSLQNLEEHSLGTLQALVAAVDAKDSYTASHSLSVTDYAVAIGKRLRLSAEQLADLERASLLHDIGKIGIPESILLKPSRLTAEEYEVIKRHSVSGAHIIESIPFLRSLVAIVRHHHEQWDGSGYPDGLAGPQIPLLARVLAVADAFDAMTSDRPYRPGMRLAAARQELLRYRGLQFDPAVVDALLEAVDAEEIVVALYHRGQRNLQQVSA